MTPFSLKRKNVSAQAAGIKANAKVLLGLDGHAELRKPYIKKWNLTPSRPEEGLQGVEKSNALDTLSVFLSLSLTSFPKGGPRLKQ